MKRLSEAARLLRAVPLKYEVFIAAHPNWFGKKYDEIRKGLLGCKTRRHIIFYMIDPKGDIIVIRILHERMDLKNKF